MACYKVENPLSINMFLKADPEHNIGFEAVSPLQIPLLPVFINLSQLMNQSAPSDTCAP